MRLGPGGRLLVSFIFSVCFAAAQTTQGLIAGRLVNSQSGAPVAGAQVAYSNAATGASGVATSDRSGNYFLPLLSPGFYRVRATANGFQSREVQELELPVAADTGTARGLGLAINGQRPSSSNFMLDGLENNNYLVTGPLSPVAPEAIEEYRVSTNNFSAEYGRTSGFVANAVTRSGGNQFHGIGYFYLNNDVLNANGFQANLQGLPRNPDKQNQIGFQVGGPILKDRLFFSGSFDHLRSR